MDEAWMYVYDPTLKQQSMEWLRKEKSRLQKPRRRLFVAKVMLVAFFDIHGMVYFEYVQCPQTINQIYFRGIFRRFDEAFRRRCPRSTVRGRLFVHMDNTPVHNANLTLQLIRNLGWSHLPQLPYSPDLAPCDFWLFQRIKKDLRGRRFRDLAELKDTGGADRWNSLTRLQKSHPALLAQALAALLGCSGE